MADTSKYPLRISSCRSSLLEEEAERLLRTTTSTGIPPSVIRRNEATRPLSNKEAQAERRTVVRISHQPATRSTTLNLPYQQLFTFHSILEIQHHNRPNLSSIENYEADPQIQSIRIATSQAINGYILHPGA